MEMSNLKNELERERRERTLVNKFGGKGKVGKVKFWILERKGKARKAIF